MTCLNCRFESAEDDRAVVCPACARAFDFEGFDRMHFPRHTRALRAHRAHGALYAAALFVFATAFLLFRSLHLHL